MTQSDLHGDRAMRGRATHRQRGAMSLLVALSLPLLLGLVALVLDLGRAYVIKAEVQNAMDACALAASASLTGVDDPGLFDAARAQALALSDPGAQGNSPRPSESINRVNFQSEELSASGIEVAFASSIDGPYVAATTAQPQGLAARDARYARCRYTDASRALWMMPVLRAFGLDTAEVLSVSASAVASLLPAQQVCAVPMAVCAAPGSGPADHYGLGIGQRITAINDPRNGYGGGHFGWADFDPPNGGASALASQIEGAGACSVRIGQSIGQSGRITSLERSWNTRFGIYLNASHALDAAPDRTGHGYAAGSGHYADYLQRRASHATFQGQTGGAQVALTSAEHAQWGQQRRIVTAPVVNCNAWNSGQVSATPEVLDLACMLMLAPVRSGSGPVGAGVAPTMDLEFLGIVGRDPSPCASSGLSGGSGGALVPGLVQ